jgi:hypothetical protein
MRPLVTTAKALVAVKDIVNKTEAERLGAEMLQQLGRLGY